MKTYIVLLSIFFGIHCPLFSQVNPQTQAADSTDSIYAYGIQFYLVNGLSFAVKFNESLSDTWRLKFDFSATASDLSSSTRYYQNDQFDRDQEYSSDSDDFNIGLSFEYNYFFDIHNQLRPYLGLGPYFSSLTNYGSHKSGEGTPLYRYNSKKYGAGIVSVAGIECSLFDYAHFFIEYDARYIYYLARNEQKEIIPASGFVYRYKGTSHQHSFTVNSVKMGLILYF